MARDIDRKLRLTAALLGAITCKDLAAAFRRVNPATSFDVERAHKWLQGRARPRELQVYEDWAALLDLGHAGEWIAECDADVFLDAICGQRQLAPETLLRRAKSFGGRPDGHLQESVSKHELVGICLLCARMVALFPRPADPGSTNHSRGGLAPAAWNLH